MGQLDDNIDETSKHEPPHKLYKKDSTMGSVLTDNTEEMGPTQDTVELSASEDENPAPINKQGTIQKFVESKPQKPKLGTFDTSVPLPTYFKCIRVALRGNFDPAMKTLLYRYVNAYSG